MRDDELRARFQALRKADAAEAPGFAETLAGARRQQPPRRFDGWSWAAVAAAVPAIAVVAMAVSFLASNGPTPGETMALDTWSSPTTGLVADLGGVDDPLAALEAFQSPTAGLLNLDDRSTP